MAVPEGPPKEPAKSEVKKDEKAYVCRHSYPGTSCTHASCICTVRYYMAVNTFRAICSLYMQEFGPYQSACKKLEDEMKGVCEEIAKLSGVRETDTGKVCVHKARACGLYYVETSATKLNWNVCTQAWLHLLNGTLGTIKRCCRRVKAYRLLRAPLFSTQIQKSPNMSSILNKQRNSLW